MAEETCSAKSRRLMDILVCVCVCAANVHLAFARTKNKMEELLLCSHVCACGYVAVCVYILVFVLAPQAQNFNLSYLHE